MLKEQLKPTEVARRYLGAPKKISCGNHFYMSPFRNERTASLCVNDSKGFHDFGDGFDGDIIGFVERLFNVSFIEAAKILSNDFGISIDNEYETSSVTKIIKEQREIAAQRKTIIENWYEETFNELCNLYHLWADVKEQLRDKTNAIGDFAFGYDTAIDKVFKTEYLLDYIIDNCNNKEALFNDREGIECYMKAI